MNNILPYKEILPDIASSVFISPNAYFMDDVKIGEEREARISKRTNIQDNFVIHVAGQVQRM